METCLAIISDVVWFTPALLVMFAIAALLAEVLFRRPQATGEITDGIPAASRLPDLEVFNVNLLLRLLSTIGVAVLTGICALAVAQANNLPLVNGVMFAGSGIAMGLMLWTWNLTAPWKTAQREVETERMVGRDLNLLMLDGCRVFHHLVNDRVGDIDHIIVAPHAVFLVETYAGCNPAKAATNTVAFNGQDLIYPKRTTNDPIKKAAGKARWLEGYLEHRTGISLKVHPVIALPGWEVRRSGAGEVHVLNPKEIASLVVDKAAQPLYDAQRQRIINLLDSQCQYAPF